MNEASHGSSRHSVVRGSRTGGGSKALVRPPGHGAPPVSGGHRTGPGPPAPWSTPRPRPPPGRRSSPWSDGQLELVGQPRHGAEPGPGGLGRPRGTDGHQAAARRDPRRAAHATSSGTSSRGTPPRPGSPARSTCTSTAAPGRRRAMARPSSSRHTACQQLTTGASRATLFRWTAPRKCHAGPDGSRRHRRGRLGHQLVGVVLPDVGRARRPGRPSPPHAEPLGHRDHGHRRRDRCRHRRCARGWRPDARSNRRTPALRPVTGRPAPPPDQTTRAWRPVSPRARWEK